MKLDLKNHNLAFVDLETIGQAKNNGRIIDVGIIKVRNSEVIDTYNQLINPGVTIDYFTTNLTGIRNQDLVHAPSFSEVHTDISHFLRDSVFVAHNVSFDYTFLSEELTRNKIIYSAPQLCTVKLSRFLYRNELSHSLSSIITKFGIEVKNRHRAYDDAFATWEFFQKVTQTFNEYTLDIAFQNIFKPAKFEWTTQDKGQMSLF